MEPVKEWKFFPVTPEGSWSLEVLLRVSQQLDSRLAQNSDLVPKAM